MSLKPYSPTNYLSYAWNTTIGYLSEKPIVGLLLFLGLGIGTFVYQLADSWEPAVAELLRFVVFTVGGGFASFIILYLLALVDAPRAVRCEMMEIIRGYEEVLSPARISARLSLNAFALNWPDSDYYVGLVKVTNLNEAAAYLYGVPLGVYHEEDNFQENCLQVTSNELRWAYGGVTDRQCVDSNGGVGYIEIAKVNRLRDRNDYGLWLTYRHAPIKLQKSGEFKIDFEVRGKVGGREIKPIPYSVRLNHEEGAEIIQLTEWPYEDAG